ncbi:OsmC family protein [Ningiella sp. W23]|uniref:OsmC family protein n=1 Tax=Ningiella sp. W23 TaxID=3023715 RepID=UPI0037571A75
MKASVNWRASSDGLMFDAVMDSGQSMTFDGSGAPSAASDGQTTQREAALSPMQAVLMSVGACSSVDVVEIMRKARQGIEACVCQLEAKRADDAPKVFTQIHAHYLVTGTNIKEKQLARAVQLSCEKYCSVMLMINSKVDITTSYEIKEN